jgi:hypothetical protein
VSDADQIPPPQDLRCDRRGGPRLSKLVGRVGCGASGISLGVATPVCAIPHDPRGKTSGDSRRRARSVLKRRTRGSFDAESRSRIARMMILVIGVVETGAPLRPKVRELLNLGRSPCPACWIAPLSSVPALQFSNLERDSRHCPKNDPAGLGWGEERFKACWPSSAATTECREASAAVCALLNNWEKNPASRAKVDQWSGMRRA